MKRAKKIYVIGALLLAIITATTLSYALYQREVDVDVTTISGEMICDIEVDTNDNYIENNEAYFYIYVKNFENRDGINYLSATDVDYTITIENTGSDQGLFRYVDEEGNSSEEGVETLTIENSIGNDEEMTKRIRIYVSGTNDLEQNVDFKVSLDAVQKDMEG